MNPVLEFRVALTTKTYERLVKFYCDGLGLDPAAIWNNDGGNALMLAFEKGTLEIFDERQAEVIDTLEVGKRVSGQIRFAFQVPDLDAAIKRLRDKGEVMISDPVMTPWGDYNVRFQDPDGLQITLFETKQE